MQGYQPYATPQIRLKTPRNPLPKDLRLRKLTGRVRQPCQGAPANKSPPSFDLAMRSKLVCPAMGSCLAFMQYPFNGPAGQ